MRRRFMAAKNDVNKYLSIRALENNVEILFETIHRYSFKYSINGGRWLEGVNATFKYELNKDEIISFKSFTNYNSYLQGFKINGRFELFGNCMSLLYGYEVETDSPATSYCFRNLFAYNADLVSVSKNFLPATTLTKGCYDSMFVQCSSLINAPELPATQLAEYCYASMFNGCKNLNYIKMLATDISATNCLSEWVSGVSSTGTFVKSKDATWDVRGANGIPNNWKIEYDHNYDIGSDISFHIERIDETLYAKDWMTWDDWVHSKYNTVSAYIISSGHDIFIPSYSWYPLNTYPDNIIKNGGTYYFQKSGGGSD